VGRLLFAIERFRVFGAIPAEIIPAASSVFVLLCFTAYFFASLGMILFGGLITRDPLNDTSQLLEGTSFTASKYWANNFNDMLSSLCVLFNLMIVNNWITEASGLEAASGHRWLVRLFIFSFHLVGVIGISNVTTSLIINGFFQQFDQLKSGAASDEKIEEVVLTGSWSKSRAIFDPSIITGTETGLPNILYSVRVKSRHSFSPSVINDREVLRKLFSKASDSSSDNELFDVQSILEEE
jgi:low affinity Fe/Cu permease